MEDSSPRTQTLQRAVHIKQVAIVWSKGIKPLTSNVDYEEDQVRSLLKWHQSSVPTFAQYLFISSLPVYLLHVTPQLPPRELRSATSWARPGLGKQTLKWDLGVRSLTGWMIMRTTLGVTGMALKTFGILK